MSNVLLLKVLAAPYYSKCTVERNDFTIRRRCVQPTLELSYSQGLCVVTKSSEITSLFLSS